MTLHIQVKGLNHWATTPTKKWTMSVLLSEETLLHKYRVWSEQLKKEKVVVCVGFTYHSKVPFSIHKVTEFCLTSIY